MALRSSQASVLIAVMRAKESPQAFCSFANLFIFSEVDFKWPAAQRAAAEKDCNLRRLDVKQLSWFRHDHQCKLAATPLEGGQCYPPVL